MKEQKPSEEALRLCRVFMNDKAENRNPYSAVPFYLLEQILMALCVETSRPQAVEDEIQEHFCDQCRDYVITCCHDKPSEVKPCLCEIHPCTLHKQPSSVEDEVEELACLIQRQWGGYVIENGVEISIANNIISAGYSKRPSKEVGLVDIKDIISLKLHQLCIDDKPNNFGVRRSDIIGEAVNNLISGRKE